jgi:hypothetical protein
MLTVDAEVERALEALAPGSSDAEGFEPHPHGAPIPIAMAMAAAVPAPGAAPGSLRVPAPEGADV